MVVKFVVMVIVDLLVSAIDAISVIRGEDFLDYIVVFRCFGCISVSGGS